MASPVEPVSQVETLIQEKRALEPVDRAFRFAWLDSADFTQFLLKWQLRPKVFSITKIFADELLRRRGLRAYGVKVAGRRRSKINQIGSNSVAALEPRQLEVAKTEAA